MLKRYQLLLYYDVSGSLKPTHQFKRFIWPLIFNSSSLMNLFNYGITLKFDF